MVFFRLIKINFDNPKEDNWETLLKEHPSDVLDWVVAVNHSKLVVCYMHDVVVSKDINFLTVVLRNLNGEILLINFPFLFMQDIIQYLELSDCKLLHTFDVGIGNIVGFSGKKKSSEIFFKMTNFLTPGIIYRCQLNDTELKTEVRFLFYLKVILQMCHKKVYNLFLCVFLK